MDSTTLEAMILFTVQSVERWGQKQHVVGQTVNRKLEMKTSRVNLPESSEERKGYENKVAGDGRSRILLYTKSGRGFGMFIS